MPRAKKEDPTEEDLIAEAIAEAIEETRLEAIVEADIAKHQEDEVVEAPKSSEGTESESGETEGDSGPTTEEVLGGAGDSPSEEVSDDGGSDGEVEASTEIKKEELPLINPQLSVWTS